MNLIVNFLPKIFRWYCEGDYSLKDKVLCDYKTKLNILYSTTKQSLQSESIENCLFMH